MLEDLAAEAARLTGEPESPPGDALASSSAGNGDGIVADVGEVKTR